MEAQQPAPITTQDFIVSGVGLGSDSASVRRRLGHPDSVQVSDHPFVTNGKIVDWWFPQLRISFYLTDSVSGFWIMHPGIVTARGVQVGDSVAKVRRLYGRPTLFVREENAFLYALRNEDSHYVKIWFARGFVRRVFLGVGLD